jgi:hypothetical protein
METPKFPAFFKGKKIPAFAPSLGHFRWSLRGPVFDRENLQILRFEGEHQPIGSMVLVYMLTLGIY